MARKPAKRGRKREPKADRLLTPKQLRFCQEYTIDLNATQAAIRSGYSARSAEMTGSRMMSNDKVRAEIARLQSLTAARLEVSREWVIAETRMLAGSNLAQVVKVDRFGRILVNALDELPPEVQRCIESVKQVTTEVPDGAGGVVERVQLSVKLHSKLGALQLLAKLCGFEAPVKVDAKLDGKLDVKAKHVLSPEVAREMKIKFLGIDPARLTKGEAKRKAVE